LLSFICLGALIYISAKLQKNLTVDFPGTPLPAEKKNFPSGMEKRSIKTAKKMFLLPWALVRPLRLVAMGGLGLCKKYFAACSGRLFF